MTWKRTQIIYCGEPKRCGLQLTLTEDKLVTYPTEWQQYNIRLVCNTITTFLGNSSKVQELSNYFWNVFLFITSFAWFQKILIIFLTLCYFQTIQFPHSLTTYFLNFPSALYVLIFEPICAIVLLAHMHRFQSVCMSLLQKNVDFLSYIFDSKIYLERVQRNYLCSVFQLNDVKHDVPHHSRRPLHLFLYFAPHGVVKT